MFSTNWPLMMEWTPALLLPIASFLAPLSLLLLLSSLKGNMYINQIHSLHSSYISALFHLQITYHSCKTHLPVRISSRPARPLPLLFLKRNTNATRKLSLFFWDRRGLQISRNVQMVGLELNYVLDMSLT